MKKIFSVVCLVLVIAGFVGFFPVGKAHASTLKTSVDFSHCVQISENDGGWGTVSNVGGTQLNFNGLFFGAVNNCGVDALKVGWAITWSGSCPAGTKGAGGGVVKSGHLDLMPNGDFDKFFGGTIIFKCVFDSDPSIYTPPATALVGMTVDATVSGGHSSHVILSKKWA